MVELRPEDVERVARTVHDLLRGSLDGESPYRAQSYEELDGHIKEANRQQIRRAPLILAELGFRVEHKDCDGALPEVRLSGALPEVRLSEEEIERASVAEHEGWRRQKIATGYRFGPVRDDLARTHPSLVPWEELTDSVRNLDRQRVRLLPWIASMLKLKVQR